MENTPTPYQRQRRASRLAPQQDAQPLQPPLEASSGVPEQAAPPAPTQPAPQNLPYQPASQPMQPRVPVRPAQPTRISYNAMQQSQQAFYPPTQQLSGYPQRQAAYPQQQPQGLTPAHPLPQSSGNRTPRALQQRPMASSGWSTPTPQPVARGERPSAAPPPSMERTVPAGERPHASANSRRSRPADEPVDRRVPAKEAPRRRADRESAAAPSRPVEKRKTPAWLLTALSLLLIGVMALVAFDFLMQAYLKTAADEKQAAYEAILSNYHVTEQADGTLRVTWQDTIEKYAEQYNLNPAFVTAVIRNESSFRTNAESSAGARGLMQMMPDTAEWVAGKLKDSYDFDRLYDAETSIRYGCWYLNYLSELFRGDPVLVCAAYHAGQGEVWGWLGDPSISPDGVTVPIENIPISNTKTYAGRVTQAYGIYQTLLYPQSTAIAPSGAVPDGGGAASDLFAAAAR